MKIIFYVLFYNFRNYVKFFILFDWGKFLKLEEFIEKFGFLVGRFAVFICFFTWRNVVGGE